VIDNIRASDGIGTGADMDLNQTTRFYRNLEQITQKWWFYLLLFLVCFIPPYSSTGFSGLNALVELVKYVADAIIAKKLFLMPYMHYLHVGMYLLFAVLMLRGNRFGRTFSRIVGLHFLLIMFMQVGAYTDRYGLVFYPNAFILIFSVALAWIWEGMIHRNDYALRRFSAARSLVVAGAIFSFWNPDQAGDYRLVLFLTSTSPIAYCMMSTVYLALLCILYPRVNLPLFRLSSYVNILIGIVTVGMGIFMDDPLQGRYWSLLHTPMILVALYSFRLSLRPTPLVEVKQII
jgi:hypothetical protein